MKPGTAPASGGGRMSLKEQVVRRAVEPGGIRYYQWRGDPFARWLRSQTKADPYPLYASMRQHEIVHSALGLWVTASHPTAASILRDRRFSSSPEHQPGYRPPEYPP